MQRKDKIKTEMDEVLFNIDNDFKVEAEHHLRSKEKVESTDKHLASNKGFSPG